jgi:hypothetical protein
MQFLGQVFNIIPDGPKVFALLFALCDCRINDQF